MNRLEGKSILVTGAASGIGRAIALRFAAEGARLVLADVTATPREGGTPTLELLRASGAVADLVFTDVADEAAAQAAVDFLLARDGRIDVLVNDAAISVGRPLTELSLADWNRVMAVNLGGVFLMARAAVRAMLTQAPRADGTRGRLVNISSQHGMIAAPQDVSYGTSKAGVAYITRQIAADYAAQGIVCNAVAPGKIQTGAGGRAVDPVVMERAERRTPWPRLGRPDDVARAVLFLASSDARFVTGAELMVDGGWMAA